MSTSKIGLPSANFGTSALPGMGLVSPLAEDITDVADGDQTDEIHSFDISPDAVEYKNGMLFFDLPLSSEKLPDTGRVINGITEKLITPDKKQMVVREMTSKINSGDLSQIESVRYAFSWLFESAGELFKGVMILKRVGRVEYSLGVQLNLIRWQYSDGQTVTIKPNNGELQLIKRAFLGFLNDVPFKKVLEHYLSTIIGDSGLAAIITGQGILPKSQFLSHYIQRTYPNGITLEECLDLAAVMQVPLTAIFSTMIDESSELSRYQKINIVAKKIGCEASDIARYYVSDNLYPLIMPELVPQVIVQNLHVWSKELVCECLTLFYGDLPDRPTFDQLAKYNCNLSLDELVLLYYGKTRIGDCWQLCGPDFELLSLWIRSEVNGPNEDVLSFYFGEESKEFILRNDKKPSINTLKQFGEPLTTRLLVYYYGKNVTRLLSEKEFPTRSQLSVVSNAYGLSTEDICFLYYGEINDDPNFYPTVHEISELSSKLNLESELLIRFYYGQDFAKFVQSYKGEVNWTELIHASRISAIAINTLEHFYGTANYHTYFGSINRPSLADIKCHVPAAEQRDVFIYFYGRKYLPLFTVKSLESPTVYQMMEMCNKWSFEFEEVWSVYYSEESPEDVFPEADSLLETNKDDYLKLVAHYYGPKVRDWVASYPLNTRLRAYVSLRDAILFIKSQSNLEPEIFLKFVYGKHYWKIISVQDGFSEVVKMVLGDNPTYGKIVSVSNQAGVAFEEFVKIVYGSEFNWSYFVEHLSKYAVSSKRIRGNHDLAREISAVTRMTITDEDLSLLGASDRYPNKRIMRILARYSHIDVELLYYLINRNRMPDITPGFTQCEGAELYPDDDLGAFVYSILENIAKVPTSDPYWQNRHVSRSIFYNFFQLKNPPGESKLSDISRATGIPIVYIMAFVIDRIYPELRMLLNKMGYGYLQFWVDPHNDPERITYYKSNPDKLGFHLWLARKRKGYNIRELTTLLHTTRNHYYNLEGDTHQHPGYFLLGKLADVLGLSLDELKKLATYTYENVQPETKVVGIAPENSVKAMLLSTIGSRTYEAYIKEAICAFEKLTGIRLNSGRILEALFELPAQSRVDDPKNAILTKEMDLNLAVVLSLSGRDKKMNAAQFLARARPELRLIFDGFSEDNAVLTLPDGTTLEDIFDVSVPKSLASLIYDEGLSRGQLAQRLGNSSNPMLATMYESMDYPIVDMANYISQASVSQIDPRLLYLSRNPWLLLWIPVREESSKKLIKWAASRTQLGAVLGAYWRQLSDGRVLLKDLLQTFGVLSAAEFVNRGASDKLAKKIFVPHGRIKLYTAELLEIKKVFSEVNGKALLEGFKKGELLYFMGQDHLGGVDYQLPRGWSLERIKGLDLEAFNRVIYEKLKRDGQTFKQFWTSQPGVSVKTSLTSFEVDRGELDLERMVRYVRLAQQAGIDPDELNLKALYIHQMYSLFETLDISI